MNGLYLATAVILLGGVGTWLLLPHRLGRMTPKRVQSIGAALTILALLLLSGFYSAPSSFVQNAFFYAFATAAVAAAIAMITSRNPVYSALWFALVVLSTSGLFLLAGAQFLAAGTIIVYAGAIIVTFLFVIMLAQSEGQALYDRAARTPAIASLCGFVLLWGVFYALIVVGTPNGPETSDAAGRARVVPLPILIGAVDATGKSARGRILPGSEPAIVISRALSPTSMLPPETTSPDAPTSSHVGGLGASLFTDHLLSVELAGTILFVALIGAIAIATPKAPIRPANRYGVAAGDPAQAEALAKLPS